MQNRTFIFISILIVSFLNFGCTRSTVESSNIYFQLPAHVSMSKAFQTQSWNSSNPSDFSSINCYAITISSPSSQSDDISCSDSAGTQVFTTDLFYGPQIAGSTMEIEGVQSGSNREIKLIGFQDSGGLGCLIPSDMSQPYVLAEGVFDLPPGDVEITLGASFNSSHNFYTCSNTPFFDGSNPDTGPQCTYPGGWDEHDFTPTGLADMMTLTLIDPVTTSDGSIYMGGSANNSAYNTYAWYVFKSTDGGVSWVEAENLIDTSPSSNYLNLLLKDNGDNVYAIGTQFDGSNNYLKIRRSTDGGVTWSEVASFLDGSISGGSVDESGNIFLYGTKTNSPLYDLYTVTSSDGVTWSEHEFTPSGLADMMTLTISKPVTTSDGSIYIAGSANNSAYNNYAWYVFKSTNGGVTWVESDNFIDASPSSNYLNHLIKDNDENIYAIGTQFDGSNNNLIIRRSTDGGATWAGVASFLDGSVSGGSVDDNGRIFLYGTKTNSPLYDLYTVTSSDGVTWNEHAFTPTGLADMMTLTITDPVTTADGSIYIGGSANNSAYNSYAWYVFKSTDGGENWIEADNIIDTSPSSNYLNRVIKDTNDNIYAIGTKFDGSNNYLVIRKSDDAGASWNQVANFLDGSISGSELDENGNILLFGTKTNSPLYDLYSVTHSCN